MKVIENNHEEKKSWKIVCPNCNSVLEYEKEDVIIKESMFSTFIILNVLAAEKR